MEKLSEKSSFCLLKRVFLGKIEFLEFLANRVFAQTPKKRLLCGNSRISGGKRRMGWSSMAVEKIYATSSLETFFFSPQNAWLEASLLVNPISHPYPYEASNVLT